MQVMWDSVQAFAGENDNKVCKRFADDTTFQDMCKAFRGETPRKLSVWLTPQRHLQKHLGFDELYKASYDLQRILGTVSCQL